RGEFARGAIVLVGCQRRVELVQRFDGLSVLVAFRDPQPGDAERHVDGDFLGPFQVQHGDVVQGVAVTVVSGVLERFERAGGVVAVASFFRSLSQILAGRKIAAGRPARLSASAAGTGSEDAAASGMARTRNAEYGDDAEETPERRKTDHSTAPLEIRISSSTA